MDKGQAGTCAGALASMEGRGRSVLSPPRGELRGPWVLAAPEEARPWLLCWDWATDWCTLRTCVPHLLAAILKNAWSLGAVLLFFFLLPFFKYL